MSLRFEFVSLAKKPGANFSLLCRQFGISRSCGYKWVRRFEAHQPDSLKDRSRKPLHSPRRSSKQVEARVLAANKRYPTWGPRKVRRFLKKTALKVPAISTVGRILARHGLVQHSIAKSPLVRFERVAPNQLWQMDFKGHFSLLRGRTHPLVLLDDHSRYVLGLWACENEQDSTVRGCLLQAFRRYGLPSAILCDNGPPWGASGSEEYTQLGVWLLRLGLQLCHGRPYHPQTQGKVERFNRTLKADAIGQRNWANCAALQRHLDSYRQIYNHQRPHQSLFDEVPASRYEVSPRRLPTALPKIQYAPGDHVRYVRSKGEATFHNRTFYLGRAFINQPIAFRPTNLEGVLDLFFVYQKLGYIDLNTSSSIPKGNYHPILKIKRPHQ